MIFLIGIATVFIQTILLNDTSSDTKYLLLLSEVFGWVLIGNQICSLSFDLFNGIAHGYAYAFSRDPVNTVGYPMVVFVSLVFYTYTKIVYNMVMADWNATICATNVCVSGDATSKSETVISSDDLINVCVSGDATTSKSESVITTDGDLINLTMSYFQ